MRNARISVVITITSGEPHLARCVEALKAQKGNTPAEIIVPVFPWEKYESLFPNDPQVRFVLVDGGSERPPDDPGNEHVTYDRRRAIGLAATTGDIIAMIEDHAIASPDWCSTMVRAHSNRWAAVGGSIRDAGGRGPLNRALYYCDFGRYEYPKRGAAAFVSDVNVSYKRECLEQVRHTWQEFYHETWVHDTMRSYGMTLGIEPSVIVHHDRGPLHLGRVLAQRFAWARLFAGRRAQAMSPRTRALYALGSPLLPAILVLRQARQLRGRRGAWLPFLTALPAMAMLVGVWACGECIGYVTARAVGGSSYFQKEALMPGLETQVQDLPQV